MAVDVPRLELERRRPERALRQLEEDVQGVALPAGDAGLGGILVGVEEEDGIGRGDRVSAAAGAARHLVERVVDEIVEEDVRPAASGAEVTGGEEDDEAGAAADGGQRAGTGGLRDCRRVPVSRSSRKIWEPVDPVPRRSAVDWKTTSRPSWLMVGFVLSPTPLVSRMGVGNGGFVDIW